WMPPHPTFFVKRYCYKEFGFFNLNYKIAADYELMLRFLGKNNISVCYLNQVLVKMRTGGTSNRSITNIFRKSAEDLKALKENKIGGYYTLVLKNFRKLNQFF
ncbi:MAG: glycosyltransferase, partial [Bacteroidales bacterium]|nr:glycosyltransferase [Bacteroidales bacterium]